MWKLPRICILKDVISVVIPAYNEEKYIGACLASLERQVAPQPFEVIVVDNASTDRTAEVVKLLAERWSVRLIHEPRKGRGAARAAGFAAARGEIILSTDADAVLPPDWLEIMSAPFVNPSIIGVTGTCYISDRSALANAIFNIVQPFITLLYRLVYGNFWLLGSNSGIRKSVYQQAGGFSLRLNSQEDTQLSIALRRYGKIQYVRASRVATSGRRFAKGIGVGLSEYVRSFFERFFLRREDVHLRDAR